MLRMKRIIGVAGNRALMYNKQRVKFFSVVKFTPEHEYVKVGERKFQGFRLSQGLD